MTRSAKKAALHNAVLLTTELLENVLEQLPMRDLLLAQRVCRKWKAVIEGSEYMQQLLFFQPGKAKFCWKYNDSDDVSRSENLVRVEAEYQLLDEEAATTRLYDEGEFNPLVFNQQSDDVIPYWESAQESGNAFAEFLPQFGHKSWSYKQASWRRMLVTQPPATYMVDGEGPCQYPYYAQCPSRCSAIKDVGRDTGLLAGDLADLIEDCYMQSSEEARRTHWFDVKTDKGLLCPSNKARQKILKWNEQTRAEELAKLSELPAAE